MFTLLLLATMIGPPAPRTTPLLECEETRKLFSGFIVDTARVGGGLVADLWSTEYALARCPTCVEGNPLGLSKNSRIWLKAGTAVGAIAGLHKLRKNGHPTWAKWLGRGLMVAQFTVAANNVRKAH